MGTLNINDQQISMAKETTRPNYSELLVNENEFNVLREEYMKLKEPQTPIPFQFYCIFDTTFAFDCTWNTLYCCNITSKKKYKVDMENYKTRKKELFEK